MSYAKGVWKKLFRKNDEEEEEDNLNNNNLGFVAKKRMIKNIATAILNALSPIAKASVIGLILDFLPYLLVTRLKFFLPPSWSDVQKLLINFHRDLISGSLARRVISNYPKRNSWITTLFFSALTFQVAAPSRIQYPPPLSNDDADLMARHGLSSSNTGLRINFSPQEAPTNKPIPGLTRLEVEALVKNFLASLASTTVGLWLLRSPAKGTKLTAKQPHHLSLALYSMAHAGHSLWTFQRLRTKAIGKPWHIQTPWLNFGLKRLGRIFEALIFGWSSYQIMICWFFYPKLLTTSYERWITKFAQVDRPLLEYLRGLKKGTIVDGKHSDFLAGYCRSIGLSPHLGDPFYGLPSCRVIHHLDGTSCSQNAARRFGTTFIRALLSLYLPLNLVTFIIRRKSQVKNKNDETLPSKSSLTLFLERVIYPSLRSSAFLGTFVGTLFGTFCLARHKTGTDRYGALAGSAVCGISSILIESPVRRLNLVLYLFPRALTSLYHGRFEKHIAAHLLDVPIFAFSLAILLTCFRLQSKSVQAPIRPVLQWVFSNYSIKA